MSFGYRDEDWVNPPDEPEDDRECADCDHSYENVRGELLCRALYDRRLEKYGRNQRCLEEWIVVAEEPCDLYENGDF